MSIQIIQSTHRGMIWPMYNTFTSFSFPQFFLIFCLCFLYGNFIQPLKKKNLTVSNSIQIFNRSNCLHIQRIVSLSQSKYSKQTTNDANKQSISTVYKNRYNFLEKGRD